MTEQPTGLGLRPLYMQVREKLIRNLVDGIWAPGDLLPSEMQLAAEWGVSQGTVRKALDAMAAENLVTRKQGRGTFVARPDDERIMFQFFKLHPDQGDKTFPKSTILSATRAAASDAEQDIFGQDGAVIRLERLRFINDIPAISETVVVPESLFPGLETMELPNNLYGLYAMHFGIAIMRSTERIKAVRATPEQARLLECSPDEPLLQITRIGYSLENTPVEWRVSTCTTARFHYRADLG